MRKTARKLLVLAFAFVFAPAIGSAQTAGGSPPVQVESCTAGQQGGLLLAKSDGAFAITFMNASTTTADLVRFQVKLGSETLYIVDAGKFSPGVTINHRYHGRGGSVISSPLLRPVSPQCSVVAVHFVDGTQWTRDASNAAEIIGDGYLGVILQHQAAGIVANLVMPDSPAAKAGLQQGDRITAIAGNKISTVSDAITLITGTAPGASVPISVMRGGQPVQITAVLGKRPSAAAQAI